MKLRDFLLLWTEHELIAIVYRSLSNGAYTVTELLAQNEYLDKTVKCAEIHIEKLDDFVAEDSAYRDEFFETNKEKELPYICLEVCE